MLGISFYRVSVDDGPPVVAQEDFLQVGQGWIYDHGGGRQTSTLQLLCLFHESVVEHIGGQV